MTMKSFGGIGMGILMFKTKFEIEAGRADALMQKIAEQNAIVADAYASLQKIFVGGLQKMAGASDLSKNLVACKTLLVKANEEIAKLQKLMSECGEAQKRALLEMPDFAMFFSEGRQDTIPTRKYFTANKDANAGVCAFEFSTPKIPAANIAEVHLARRFSRRD
jgi:hypothetical protein